MARGFLAALYTAASPSELRQTCTLPPPLQAPVHCAWLPRCSVKRFTLPTTRTRAHTALYTAPSPASDLSRRFTEDQLKWMCRQQVNWKKMLHRPMNDSPRLTQRQSAYLDFIANCKSTDCALRFPSDEEEKSHPPDAQNDPRCKWTKKNWRPKFCSNACSGPMKNSKSCQDGKAKKGKRQAKEGGPSKKAIRKEYRMLSDQERERLHKAINRLKSGKIDGVSKYDLFTSYHYTAQAPGAHWGPAFLPWHREFLKR